jgi:hypothetical protein
MTNKKFLLICGFLFLSNFLHSQNNIETLERMHKSVMDDREKESNAREIVMNYYYKTKDIVRENSNKLTQAEYDELNNYQSRNWKQITDAIRNFYGNSYYNFYSQKREFLEKYREGVLDRLYRYINK